MRSGVELTIAPCLRAQLRTFTAESVKTGTINDVKLHILVTVRHGKTRTQVMALIETGAEVCLVKKGIFPQECIQRSAKPVALTVANSQLVVGGFNEALLTLEFVAKDRTTTNELKVSTPSLLFEADIGQDMILSYAWLAERGFDVCPQRHGIQASTEEHVVWIPGVVRNHKKINSLEMDQSSVLL